MFVKEAAPGCATARGGTAPVRAGRLTRRRVARAAAGPVGASALAACGAWGGAAPAPGAGAAPATIRWFARASYAAGQVEGWLAPWREAHPQLQVEVTPVSGGTAPAKEKLLTMVAGGDVPDMVSAFTGAFLMLDVVQPIDDLIRRDRYDTSRFEPKNFEAGARHGGKVYMLPQGFGGDAVVLMYNRKLFQEGGAREPGADWRTSWSWDEFRDALRRTTRSEGDRITQVGLARYGYYLDTIPKPWGGEWLAPDFKTVTCDAAVMVDAYTRYVDLVQGDRTAAESPGVDLGAGNPFLTGRAAVASAGGAPLDFAKQADSAGIDWAFAPLPRGNLAAATTDMASTYAGLALGARAREAAWAFLKWCVDDGRLAALESRIPNTPALVETWSKQTWAGRPQVRAEVVGASLAYTAPMERLFMHPEWTGLSAPVTALWDDMRLQRKGVRAALTEAKGLIQAAVTDYERHRPKS
jgi:ABC-type glycerol-3-phosphate transport system substrate-binding protein